MAGIQQLYSGERRRQSGIQLEGKENIDKIQAGDVIESIEIHRKVQPQ